MDVLKKWGARARVYLVKVDPDGVLVWEAAFGGASWDKGWSVVEDDDGGYVVVGDTTSMGAGENDVYLVKAGSDGGLVWEMTVGGPVHDNGRSVQLTGDGGYVVVGRTWNMGAWGDVYLVKLGYDVAPDEPDEPEEPEKKGGIPGFPLESLVLGIVVSAVVLWLLRRSL